MVANGKGILAIDESHATCKQRFDALGIDCTEDTRRAYRQTLITAPGIENYVSGMILFDETIRQETHEGVSFVDLFQKKGMIPGIKVDTGAKPLALHDGELVTEGLDGLRGRLHEYREMGAQFAKWRAVINIGEGLPSKGAIKANAHALARYAALCQEAELVPMVEPEIMMDGNHSIEKCYEVTAEVLKVLFAELAEQRVALEGTILKVSMVISGKDFGAKATHQQVAEFTSRCLKENVPAEIPGIVFLSGGQSAEDSTLHLNLINNLGPHPWPISFSYGRGIQQPALNLWAMDMEKNVEEAQKVLVHRAHMNYLAAQGKHSPEVDTL